MVEASDTKAAASTDPSTTATAEALLVADMDPVGLAEEDRVDPGALVARLGEDLEDLVGCPHPGKGEGTRHLVLVGLEGSRLRRLAVQVT